MRELCGRVLYTHAKSGRRLATTLTLEVDSVNDAPRKSRPSAIHVDVPREKLIATLAAGSKRAHGILAELIRTQGDKIGNIFVDLASMNIHGTLLVAAYDYCNRNFEELKERLAARDPVLVDAINSMVSEGPRAHATQPTREPVVDAALHAALRESGVNKVLEEMGAGAEHVHRFFVALIMQMQRLGRFQVNFHVNLPTEGAHRAVFAIALAELLDKDGKPFGGEPLPTNAEVQA